LKTDSEITLNLGLNNDGRKPTLYIHPGSLQAALLWAWLLQLQRIWAAGFYGIAPGLR
jgi:hypothetical protein